MCSQMLSCMIASKKGDNVKVNVHTNAGGIKVNTSMWAVRIKCEKYNKVNDIVTIL